MPSAIHARSLSRGRSAGRGGDPGKKADWRTTATTFAGIASVLLVAAGLFYTNEANRKQQQLGLDQQKLALQGQVADRFTAAIGQLGQEDDKKQDKLSIRLGGIYGLQQLMNDAPAGKSVEPAVVQVLCAFVRTHAPRPAVPPPPPGIVPPSPADVRASIAVLANRPNPGEHPLDLSNTLLGLGNADLRGADLRGADLIDADLYGADLRDADLRDADLRRGEDLRLGVNLDRANLSGADLSGVYLGDVYLGSANLSDAHLSRADLIAVDLSDADLSGADLHGAYLSGAILSGTKLRGADLRGADLSGAKLSGLGVGGADLSGADLSGANLRGADLSGANLSETVGVTSQLLAHTQVDERTLLPPGVASPAPSR